MPDENDQNLNPGQSDYNRKTNFDPSGKAINENSDESVGRNNDNIDDLRNAEEKPDANWKNNFAQEKEAINYIQSKDIKRGKAMLRLAKRKGPLTAIILSLGGGGILIGTLLSPSLLLVNIKEIMVEKFNYQNTSMSVRTTKLLVSKMKTTSGVCGSVVSIKCKYSSMSEKQIGYFKKAGIEVIADTEASKTLTGRTIVKEIKFNDKVISPKNMISEINGNPEFRTAIFKTYNPKYAGFSDSIWKQVSAKLGISKAKKDISGATDEERLAKIQDEVKASAADIDEIKAGAEKPDGTKYTEDEAAAARKLAQEAKELTAEGTESVAKKVLKSSKSAATASINFVKITGPSDAACQAYNTIQAISVAAKISRSLQLAKYAMLFLGVADQIKAGTANPDDVTTLSEYLTAETEDENGDMKSATDSFGYKFAAFGDIGNMSVSSMRFMAGAGLAGSLSKVMTTINQNTGNSPKTACKILSNPFIQVGSLVAGIFAWIGAETVVLGAYDVAKVIAVGGIQAATYFLPSMLDDIVAGVLVDKTTIAEDAGDALTSGAAGIMSTLAKLGGNAPLTATQATGYSELGKAINNEQKSNIAVNQFDISDTNSFIGKFASLLVPYTSKSTSIASGIGSIISLSSDSISNVLTTNSYAESSQEFSTCTDLDYQDIGVATDPFCNVIYGIDTDALDIDPNTVNDELLNVSYYDSVEQKEIKRPQIDEETGNPINEYATFVNKCINRTTPIGTADDSGDDGKYCMFGNSYSIKSTSINNKYYYLHYIDQRINKGMDGEDATLNAAIDSGYDTNLSFYDSTENTNSNSNNFIAKIFNFFGIGN